MDLNAKVDALLTQEYSLECVDCRYIDVSTPDILDYIDDVNIIVESRLPLPYVSLNGKPLCWGLDSAQEIFDRIRLKLSEQDDTTESAS